MHEIGPTGILAAVLAGEMAETAVFLTVAGACTAVDTVWTLGDIGIGLTTWINIIALLVLFPQALSLLKDLESSL